MNMNTKVARKLYRALESRYTAEIMDAQAKLAVYFESPSGIGEHPDVTSEIDTLLGQLADATGKLEVLSDNYRTEYGESTKDVLKG